ncbi:putative membrane protein [Caulobacter sp. AP07]|uniref:DUF1294 domain-containing protein n=1 Tax=Caulobacter sp. AP07 TaxID=1144304 RepID=UPI0002722003|nr:DUF1294 domain-containing protein [Caulobacter sp. AP07]EJL34549.1 putative membrane protein [Caulobacter sp. AP07]
MVVQVAAILALINVAAFLLFWLDKDAARRGLGRISERTLLLVAALGGGLGALLAQQILRHKTRKQPFRTRLFLIVLVELIAGWLLVIPGVRATLAGLLGL